MTQERIVSVWPFELDKMEEWAYSEEIFSKVRILYKYITNSKKESIEFNTMRSVIF